METEILKFIPDQNCAVLIADLTRGLNFLWNLRNRKWRHEGYPTFDLKFRDFPTFKNIRIQDCEIDIECYTAMKMDASVRTLTYVSRKKWLPSVLIVDSTWTYLIFENRKYYSQSLAVKTIL